MKSKKTISILILISTLFIFLSCGKYAYRDIHFGKYDNPISSDAHEMKIDIETRKADYFHITDLSAFYYKTDVADTVPEREYIEKVEDKKDAKWSWGEFIIADDMKSITLRFNKNESGRNRELQLLLDNDKNREMVFLVVHQHASSQNEE